MHCWPAQYHRASIHNSILPLPLPLPPPPPLLPSLSLPTPPSVVCNDHHFKDDFLFYRFVNDDITPRSIKEKLGLGGSRKEKHKVEDSTAMEVDPEIYSEVGPETEENDIEDA